MAQILYKKNKRGQFYIIASLVIVFLLVGLTSITNYATLDRFDSLSHLRDEIKIEGQNVLDYGIYTELGNDDFEELIENFASIYEGKGNIYFIFGDKQRVKEFSYSEIKNFKFYAKDNEDWEEFEDSIYTVEGEDEISQIKIEIETNEVVFDIEEGKNLHFLIFSERDGGIEILTN